MMMTMMMMKKKNNKIDTNNKINNISNHKNNNIKKKNTRSVMKVCCTSSSKNQQASPTSPAPSLTVMVERKKEKVIAAAVATKQGEHDDQHQQQQEVNRMILDLSTSFDPKEVQKLSRVWIYQIMNQKSNKSINKKKKKQQKQKRSFEYSKMKIEHYLTWRKESDISSKIENYLSSSSAAARCCRASFKNQKMELSSTTTITTIPNSIMLSNDHHHHDNVVDDNDISKLSSNGLGGLYWYGVDKDSSPTLWYHANLTNFTKLNVRREMEYVALIMTAALDRMPPTTTSTLNFVMLLDGCHFLQASKRPNLIPAFAKTMMKTCPDRLKKAYIVTGSAAGQWLYNIARGVIPSNMTQKIVVTKSRMEIAKVLVKDGILKESTSKYDIPTFLGGTFVHDESITKNYYNMIERIEKKMHNKQDEDDDHVFVAAALPIS